MMMLVTKMWCPPRPVHVVGHLSLGCRQRGWLNWGVSATAGFLGYLPRQGALAKSLPKPPSEGEMRELLAALDAHDPPGHPAAAPGAKNGSSTGGKQPSNSSSSQTLQYSFKLTVGVAEMHLQWCSV